MGWRFTGGVYEGRKSILGDDNKGLLAGINRTIGKWWIGADYQSGQNVYGAWNVGIGYNFTDKIQGIIGYDHYNAPVNTTTPSIIGATSGINVQLGINL